MKKTLFIEIECGEKTCASESGKFCPFMSTRRYGTEWVCALFPTEIMFFTDLEEKEGWIQRCDECLATEEKYNKLGLEERIDNYLAKALPKEVRSLDRDVNNKLDWKYVEMLKIDWCLYKPEGEMVCVGRTPGIDTEWELLSDCIKYNKCPFLFRTREDARKMNRIINSHRYKGWDKCVVKKWSRLVFAAGLKEES